MSTTSTNTHHGAKRNGRSMKPYRIKALGQTYIGLFTSSCAAVIWAIDTLGATRASASPA